MLLILCRILHLFPWVNRLALLCYWQECVKSETLCEYDSRLAASLTATEGIRSSNPFTSYDVWVFSIFNIFQSSFFCTLTWAFHSVVMMIYWLSVFTMQLCVIMIHDYGCSESLPGSFWWMHAQHDCRPSNQATDLDFKSVLSCHPLLLGPAVHRMWNGYPGQFTKSRASNGIGHTEVVV